MLFLDDVQSLCCPRCRGRIVYRGTTRAGRIKHGQLRCHHCAANYDVRAGVPGLYHEKEVRGTDRLLRHVYDGMPAVHDPLVQRNARSQVRLRNDVVNGACPA